MSPAAAVLFACLGTLAAADGLPETRSLPWGEGALERAVLTTPSLAAGGLRLLPAGQMGPGGGRILELATLQTVPSAWSLQASIPCSGPIAAGDVLFVECWLRTERASAEDGSARSALKLERRGPPWTMIAAKDVSAGPDGAWVRRTCAGVATQAYAAGEAQLNLHMGFRPQVLQVSGLRVLDLGPGVDLRSLPVERGTYAGIEPDAAWRSAAQARIERLRKGDLAVAVRDADGRPLAGAQVRVEMLRHAFPFGSAVSADRLVKDGPDGERYRAWVQRNCSRVVLANHLKWSMWEDGAADAPDWKRREHTTRALAWLQQQGIAVRGHCLVWPSWGCSPPRLRALAADPAALRAAVDAHIGDILAATAPYGLVEWDVVNENHGNHGLTDVLGGDEVARWFRLARQGFPQGGLVYNDFAHLRPGDAGHREYVEAAVLRLKAAGAPITALGIQSHFSGPVAPAAILAELDRLGGRLGIPLAITEFDVESIDGDAELQAAFTRDFLTASFSHPDVDQILAWGFWAVDHWMPSAAMLDRDWTPRPNALAWDALVRGAWWTDASATSDAGGACTVRGFKGRHRVTATLGGRSVSAEADIGDAPATIRITL